MAHHRETTFKNTRSQYLTDHSALHGQPCAMRPTSLGRRHGKGLGGKRQKCWKASYRISAMLISKSMSEAESQPTSYKHIIYDIHVLPWIVIFHHTLEPQNSFWICLEVFTRGSRSIMIYLHNNLIRIRSIISVCNTKTSGAAHSK